jgi:hypothetical protein
MKAWPISLNDSVSDEAAQTRISPLTGVALTAGAGLAAGLAAAPVAGLAAAATAGLAAAVTGLAAAAAGLAAAAAEVAGAVVAAGAEVAGALDEPEHATAASRLSAAIAAHQFPLCTFIFSLPL